MGNSAAVHNISILHEYLREDAMLQISTFPFLFHWLQWKSQKCCTCSKYATKQRNIHVEMPGAGRLAMVLTTSPQQGSVTKKLNENF